MHRRLRLPQRQRESIREGTAYLFARRTQAASLVRKPHAGGLADRDGDGKSCCRIERPGRNRSRCRNELEHFTQSVSEKEPSDGASANRTAELAEGARRPVHPIAVLAQISTRLRNTGDF